LTCEHLRLCRAVIGLYNYCMHTEPFTPISICGDVTAGRPATSEEIEPGCIAVDLSTIGISQNTRTFALRVRGDSMIGAHILDGDTIVLMLWPINRLSKRGSSGPLTVSWPI